MINKHLPFVKRIQDFDWLAIGAYSGNTCAVFISDHWEKAGMAGISSASSGRRRIHLYGCGVVAPGAATLEEFLSEVENQECGLVKEEKLNGAFLVGKPKFDFSIYQGWFSSRKNPTRFTQLNDKAGENVKFAVGTTIQALACNPGLEDAITALDPRVLVCYGSGFGDLNHMFQGIHEFDNATRRWNHFWAKPERNEALAAYLKSPQPSAEVPPMPSTLEADSPERADASLKWDEYWTQKSTELVNFVNAFNEIEGMTIGADVANDKLNVIRAKARARKALVEKYGCPQPPWEAVSPSFLWNLPNAPAAQVSMLLGIHGVSYASFGACATFGLILRQAMDGILSGNYDAAIIGTVDVTPPPTVVAAFHSAKVLAAGPTPGIPLCELRGTHVSGGACTWILAAEDVMEKYNLKPFHGIELLGIGLSSDAEHIITPSLEGPKHCIRESFRQAGISPKDVDTWDMHATGTPGDWSEFKLIEDFVPADAVITARKGIFGHGMSTCGGWELTAQAVGTRKVNGKYTIAGSGISPDAIHPGIKALNRNIATDKTVTISARAEGIVCGKLSMGIGGVSSCVLTRVTL